jgi:transcriptional antiterminator RfaH
MDWHVLHLKPRREKKMAEHCRLLGYPYYLPLRSETKIYQRRRVTVAKPVFSGYIFAGFDSDGRAKLLRTDNIVRILTPDNRRELLHQLAQVRKALAVDPSLSAGEALARGQSVCITGGPFMGVEGRIEAVKSSTKVRLNVEMIGQAIIVEVDREFLEILD